MAIFNRTPASLLASLQTKSTVLDSESSSAQEAAKQYRQYALDAEAQSVTAAKHRDAVDQAVVILTEAGVAL